MISSSKRSAKSLLRPLLSAWGGTPKVLGPEHWGLTLLQGRGLALGEIALNDLLDAWGSPLFLVDAGRLRQNVADFLRAPAGRKRGCEVFYSYKTNPVEGVLRLLHEQGIGAEVISPYELWLARRLGVPPARIIYNGPAKSDESIRDAIEMGIEAINCNHREEIARVGGIAKALGRRVRIGIRVTTDDSWKSQFGTPVSGGQALAAFAEAQATPLLDVVGVHAHRGGMMRTEDEVRQFVTAILGFAGEVEAKLGLSIETLNFGGSLGLPTVSALSSHDRRLNQTFHRDLPPPPITLGIERYLELLLGLVDEHYARVSRKVPRVLLEPGRALTGSAQMLLARVLTINDTSELRFAVLDAGINLAESVRSEYHQVLCVNRFGEPSTRTHCLVGPICSPGDTLYPAVRLPELVAGDSLAIMDAGAYFVPFSTSFSFPRPAIVLASQGEVTLLRRRETFEDLVRHDETRLGEP